MNTHFKICALIGIVGGLYCAILCYKCNNNLATLGWLTSSLWALSTYLNIKEEENEEEKKS